MSSWNFVFSGADWFEAANWGETVAVGGAVAAVILRGVLATAVFADAAERRQRGGRLDLLGPGGWALVVAIGGLFGAALYWFVNGFRRREAAGSPERGGRPRHHALRLPRPGRSLRRSQGLDPA